ncbi:MAG: nuclear transport factor 2 family protein [Ectothiorhodospiraceae bacterium]|nr:nuclear transport factor 2 family protein [Ectothiorhodospiraceae bacterium]
MTALAPPAAPSAAPDADARARRTRGTWPAAGLALLLAVTAAHGQDGREADHEALRGLMARARDAVNARDPKAIETVLAPGFVLVMADQSLVTDTASLRQYLARLFEAEDAPLAGIELAPEADAPTEFLGPDVGVARGRSSDTYTLRAGGALTLESRWTATVARVDGEWRIKTFHAGVNMVDNPILDAATHAGYAWGGGGLVLGGVLGLVLGRRRRRAPG